MAAKVRAGIRLFGKRAHVLGNVRTRRTQARKNRRLQRMLYMRPLRSPTKPVDVVFVCFDGGTSGVQSLHFKTYLKKSRLRSCISSRFVALRKSDSRSIYDIKSGAILRDELSNADFVIESVPTSQTIGERLQMLMPKSAGLLVTQGPLLTSETQFFASLCRRIRREFRFQQH